jgi:excisionase family DNA binding protein
MKDATFLSTSQLAQLLGISRIAVFKKIKKGQIKARKVGRNYIINQNDVGNILGTSLSAQDKHVVDAAVNKTLSEYGETLRLLGSE